MNSTTEEYYEISNTTNLLHKSDYKSRKASILDTNSVNILSDAAERERVENEYYKGTIVAENSGKATDEDIEKLKKDAETKREVADKMKENAKDAIQDFSCSPLSPWEWSVSWPSAKACQTQDRRTAAALVVDIKQGMPDPGSQDSGGAGGGH